MNVPTIKTVKIQVFEDIVKRSARDLREHRKVCVPCRTPGVSCDTGALIKGANKDAKRAVREQMQAEIEELEENEKEAWQDFLNHSSRCPNCAVVHAYCDEAATLLKTVTVLRDRIGWGPR